MSAVTSLGVTFNTTAGNKTVVATPAVRSLILVITAHTEGTPGLTTLTDDNADGHGTYTSLFTLNPVNGVSAARFTPFIRDDLIQSATSTTWTSVPGAVDTGGGLQVFQITLMTLAGPASIRQIPRTTFVAAATPAVTMTVTPLTTNPLIGWVWNGTNPATMTPPTSWTERADVGYNTPATGMETASIDSGFTSGTTTWGSTSATQGNVGAIELNAAQGGNAQFLAGQPELLVQQAVKRAATFCLGEKWARKGRLWLPSAERDYVLA